MSTITLKNYAGEDVSLSLIGADLSNARFSAVGLNSSNLTVDLAVSQQRPALGTKAAHRVTVKASHEEAVTSSSGTISISKQGVSLLITIPPGGTLARTLDEWAFIRAHVDTKLTDLWNGIVG